MPQRRKIFPKGVQKSKRNHLNQNTYCKKKLTHYNEGALPVNDRPCDCSLKLLTREHKRSSQNFLFTRSQAQLAGAVLKIGRQELSEDDAVKRNFQNFEGRKVRAPKKQR